MKKLLILVVFLLPSFVLAQSAPTFTAPAIIGTPSINSDTPASAKAVKAARAVNFLLISDGSAVLRYSTPEEQQEYAVNKAAAKSNAKNYLVVSNGTAKIEAPNFNAPTKPADGTASSIKTTASKPEYVVISDGSAIVRNATAQEKQGYEKVKDTLSATDTKSNTELKVKSKAVKVARAVNYLLISDGSAVLRYST